MKIRIRPFTFSLLATLLLFYSCQIIKATGKTPSAEDQKKMEQLPNYENSRFQNIDPKEAGNLNIKQVFKDMLNRPETVRPDGVMPSVITDLIQTEYDKPTVIWFGHSSFLIKTKTANILFDPNFSSFAGPVSWFVKAFEGTTSYGVEEMPEIDVLVISHDHYDHLDYQTVRKLKSKVKSVIVPLGVGSHFVHWGYDPKIVHELNWHQSIRISDQVLITATPARHTSARGFATDKTLWASFIVNADGYKIFYSGDGGYGTHFKLIGQQYGPFDLAMMECGQYSENWREHHMFPAQTAQAAADINARMIVPVHWAKFAESHHPWNESITLLLPAADSLKIPVSIPQIGEPFTIGDPIKRSYWWEGN